MSEAWLIGTITILVLIYIAGSVLLLIHLKKCMKKLSDIYNLLPQPPNEDSQDAGQQNGPAVKFKIINSPQDKDDDLS